MQSREIHLKFPAFVCNRRLTAVLTGGVPVAVSEIHAPCMGRQPRIPPALTHGPITLSDAYRHGLNRWNLQGAAWRRIGPGTYLPAALEETPILRVKAANGRLPPGAVVSGFTAAWLHGLDVSCDPIEITVPDGSVSARAGMIVRRSALHKGDVVHARGFRVTSPFRTLLDLCGRLPLVEAVVVTDMALHVRLVRVDKLRAATDESKGSPGVRMLRQVLDHAEAATESPMETRLRMLLVLRGLPRPEAQVDIHDRFHRFLGRPDLYYREQRLGLEYDGAVHRETLVEDNRRQNRLVDAGVRLLRFTAGDIYNTPDLVISAVRAALAT